MTASPATPPRRIQEWAVLVILSTALVVLFATNVAKKSFLVDDAYISFRYARHLAEGSGLVWNPGERVEGYSNFLWVVAMAGAMKLGIPPETAAKGIGIASGALLLLLVTACGLRGAGWRDPIVWLCPFLLAANHSFTAWCTGGLETMAFTLVVFAAVMAFLAERRRGVTRPLGSSALFAIAALTRPEGVLFAAICGAFLLGDCLTHRRRWTALIAWATPLVLIVGGHLLWRYSYYGFWLPNTFYAKVPGSAWARGADYLWLFVTDYGLAWILPLLPLAVLLQRSYQANLFFAIVAVHTLYVGFVGGDYFEFRFLVTTLPFFYLLVADALRAVAARSTRWSLGSAAVAVLIGWLAFAHTVGFSEPRRYRGGVAPISLIRIFTATRANAGRRLHSLIEAGLLDSNLLFATSAAGAVPYFTGWPTVDVRGLNDVTIARLPIAKRGHAGHERAASVEYLDKRRVAILEIQPLVFRSERQLLDNWKKRTGVEVATVSELPEWVPYRFGPGQVRLRVLRLANDELLVFGTFLDDAKFALEFPGLQVLR